jgi:S1-C subfamily serine protease
MTDESDHSTVKTPSIGVPESDSHPTATPFWSTVGFSLFAIVFSLLLWWLVVLHAMLLVRGVKVTGVVQSTNHEFRGSMRTQIAFAWKGSVCQTATSHSFLTSYDRDESVELLIDPSNLSNTCVNSVWGKFIWPLVTILFALLWTLASFVGLMDLLTPGSMSSPDAPPISVPSDVGPMEDNPPQPNIKYPLNSPQEGEAPDLPGGAGTNEPAPPASRWMACAQCKCLIPDEKESGKWPVKCPACGSPLSSSTPRPGEPEWYYALNKQKVGPLSFEQMRQLAARGQLRTEDMVWRQGTQKWLSAGNVDGLFPAESTPPSGGAPSASAKEAMTSLRHYLSRHRWGVAVAVAIGLAIPLLAVVLLLDLPKKSSSANEPTDVAEAISNAPRSVEPKPRPPVSSLEKPPEKIPAAVPVPSPGRADDDPGRKAYKITLASCAWVTTPGGVGSGWVANQSGRLVLTNFHVVGNSDDVVVVFPRYEDGKLVAERAEYRSGIRATVIATDPRRDLAVLQLQSLPDATRELKLAKESAAPGDTVHSLGNPVKSDALWVYTKGEVRQVYRKDMRYNGLHVKARIVETQSPINPGDSGGPVVNSAGELVGMSTATVSDARLISSCIDVEEIRSFLNQTLESLAEKRAWPTAPLVVRAAPLNLLAPRLRILAKQFLPEPQRKEAETLFRDWIDSEKLGPIDRKRPMAAYITNVTEKDGLTGVALVPITDTAKAKEFLQSLKVLGKADKDGIHRITVPDDDDIIYVRFAHRYAYVAFRDRALLADEAIVDPAIILSQGSSRLLSIGCRIQRIPTDLRKELRGQLKKESDDLKKIDATKMLPIDQFGGKIAVELLRWLEIVLAEGEDCGIHLQFDPGLDECSLECTLTGKAKSNLATSIRDLGKTPSLFHRVMKPNPALRVLGCARLSKPLRDAVGELFDVFPKDNPFTEFLRTKASALLAGNLDYLYEYPFQGEKSGVLQLASVQDAGGGDVRMRGIVVPLVL